MMSIGGIKVAAFEMRSGGEHDIAVLHALCHRNFDSDTEDLIAIKSSLHAILVRVNDDRIVIVDEQCPKWRVDVILFQMAADIQNVQCARAGRQEIGPGQFRSSLRESMTRTQHNAARSAKLSKERRKCNRSSNPAAAIAPSLKAVARGQDNRLGFRHPLCEKQYVACRDSANSRRCFRWPFPRNLHKFVIPTHILLDKALIMDAKPLQLDGHGECEEHIRTWIWGEVEISLFRNLGSQRIDHDQPSTFALGTAEFRNEMQIGNGGIIAPNDVELCLACRFWTNTGNRAKGPDPCLAAD